MSLFRYAIVAGVAYYYGRKRGLAAGRAESADALKAIEASTTSVLETTAQDVLVDATTVGDRFGFPTNWASQGFNLNMRN